MNHELRNDANIMFSNDIQDPRNINLNMTDEKIFNECLTEVFNLNEGRVLYGQ